MDYIEYYKKQYGVSIKNANQPLVKVMNQKMNKNLAKQKGYSEIINLIPELICLTGITDEQSSDFKLMKNLAQFTKL